jgi:glucan phosphoethanolaminetransferase (alkaline phosphatase superfamily)
VLVAVLLYVVGAQFIPRWWSHRIGDQVAQSTASGIGIGLFYGSVFTFVPLLVLWFAFRKRRPWKFCLALLATAALLATPNLLTLGIVLGTGDAAHAAERTLDVEAPYFRGSTAAGAIGAGLVFAVLMYVLVTRRRSKRTEAELREELRARDTRDASDQGAAGAPKE